MKSFEKVILNFALFAKTTAIFCDPGNEMVNLYIAYTRPVNPLGATPTLTRAHLWKGLQRKVRNAHEFVPAIVSCEVLSEDGNIVTRNVVFKEGFGESGGKPFKEVCKEYEPTKV
jgi:hypothetical protein